MYSHNQKKRLKKKVKCAANFFWLHKAHVLKKKHFDEFLAARETGKDLQGDAFNLTSLGNGLKFIEMDLEKEK